MKRILSLLLAVTMLVSGLPVQAFATVDTTAPTETVVVETTAAEETTVPEETDPSVPETTEVSATEPSVPETTEETVVETTEAVMESTEATEETVAEEEIGFFALRGSAENFSGKVISIMGDSISTFAGYIPTADGFNLEHLARYPQADLLTDVNETWWMQVITALDAKLGINDSWRGATLSGGAPVTTGTTGENAAMSNLVRIQNLGANGTPDIILLYGGTNDLAHVSKVGSFNANTAPSTVDLTTAKWDNLADGLVHTILRMRHYYPNAQIVALLPAVTASYYSNEKLAEGNAVMAQICEHYGVPYADLRECGITTADLPDGIHPNAAGMDYITEAVLDVLLSQCEMEAGENKVYSVSHLLTGAKADKHYYKGISAGAKFEETISGEDLTVTVTMGGVDITSSAYADGRISIANVTGDIVVTAKAVFSLGDRLLQLPEKLCAGLNLWTSLEHDEEYYTASGWGVHGSGKVYSVTFPVSAGDRIYATSFRKGGENGTTTNGIRVTYFGTEGMLKSLPSADVYNEYTQNGWLTVPEGANAVNVPMWTKDDSNELFLLNAEHSYENGKCTICGEKTADFSGKVISILSASTSTFAGYTPVADGFNLAHRNRYPQDNLLTDVNETWWMQTIKELDAKLGINDSWAGSQVLNTQDTNSGDLGPDAAMASLTRIQNLGANGTPDVILFFGAGNDMGRGVTAGSFDPATAPTKVDLTATKWNSLADAYVAAIMRLQHFYPDAEILVMTTYAMPSYVTKAKLNTYGPILNTICDHYGVKYLDLQDCGVTFDMLPDGIHPNAEGMDHITEAVVNMLTSEFQLEAGENTVYSVTHKLSSASASKHYYKGISAGAKFEETVEADEVTVTMGGKDITASAYANGKISIANVTGDVVITAKGEFNADGHLQQLPEEFCAGTNLWTALEPENIYYTVNGWGLFDNSPDVHSITFPVKAKDRIWATSFGKAGENGGTANGTRITWFNEDGVLETIDRSTVYTEFSKNGYITAPEGAVALNVPATTNADSYEVYILNAEHSYENGKCTICGAQQETAEPLSLRYDDHYDISGKSVEIVDAGKPTSYQVGYGVAEGTLDTAVVTVKGEKLVATGIGTAKVRMDGQLYEVTVTAAPISLLLLIGQSNMRGSEGNAKQSIVCPDGMVYSTYGDDRGADNTAMTVNNAAQFAPSALTGEYSKINVEGTTSCLSGYPLDSLTEDGDGRMGPDSGFAYEWVKQTGEKVWVVNAAHGGTSITTWQDGGDNYEEAVKLFSACQETLRKEIAAGHFTLSHMGYFWCQGCSDRTQTAKWYVNKYQAMHQNLKTELAFDADSNAQTADVAFEFGGIIPVRVGSSVKCYRDGVYETSNPYAYHESYVDLRFSGPRVAQYWMINNPELTDIWGVCNIGEDWVNMPDGTNGVADYFKAHYENGTVDYTTQVKQSASWYTPTTPAAVHDSIHYNQIGYNEIGRESVRNALILLGEMETPAVATDVKLVSWDGYTEVTEVSASTTGNSETLVVPMVYPLWKSKEVTASVTDGLTYEYYDLLAASGNVTGKLTVNGESVSVVKGQPGLLYADHLSQLPENLCSGLNLWNVLEHDKEYFASGTNWGVYSGGTVCSVTIPVKPGDKIFATSFGKAGENGHTSSNGIRTTFFGEYSVVKTMNPADTYAEFSKNGGYLIAPEGATAINVAMWNGEDTNELYILNAEHSYKDGKCIGCGEKAPSLVGKTISILGASISTYAGTSNGAAADTTNSTIRNNAKYYPNTIIPELGLNDTWWMQVAEDLDLRLLVNNAWSGSAILLERAGTVGAYVDRCVQLHDNTGDNAGEEPDIICIQMGFNDFSYGKDTLGDANIDYAALITADGYGTPSTTMEATAIMLDKITKRYPNAEVYMFNHFKRIGQSASDTALMESLNASIDAVCDRFGVTVVDLYTTLTEPAHIGDGRVHPNCLGMDVISEAVKSAIIGNTAYEVTTHTVSFNLNGVTADYGTDKIVVDGSSFTAKLAASAGDDLSVIVTMGGKDITSDCYDAEDGKIFVEAVTADVEIFAKSVHTPKDYRWEFDGTDLVGDNTLTKTAGTTNDGIFSATRYDIATSVVLSHEEPWVVEWKSEGTFENVSGSGARVFTSDKVNANYNARYIFKSNTKGIIAMGEKTTTGSHNYGIALEDYGIDWTALHTYRLENRIAEDGSNMVYLYVDGKEIGPMTHYFVGTTDKNTTSDWLSGKDFVFPYMGTDTHSFNDCAIEYIAVWEGGKTEKDPADFSGKTFSILGDSISTFAGVSNNTSFNSTIGNNELYYTEGRQDVYLEDTWWQQVMDALDMNLCVNNSWSGSTVFYPRKGVGSEGYVSRCVQLHSDQNPESPADPDVIAVFLGTNDFSYYQSTLGTADIDYDAIITDNGDGTFAYAEPATSCEAYAIMLHKMQQRYPDAQVYCMLMLPRRGNTTQPTAFNAELTEIIEHFGYTAVDLENCGITPEPEIFDVYITDKRVHPGPLGMNRIAEAVVSTMLGKKTDIHRVKWTGDAYYVQVGDITWKDSVLTGERITTTFQPEPGFEITSITVTMGGEDISRWTVNGNTVTIDSVTGDVEVTIETAVEKREPLNFHWESIGADLFETENANNTKNKLTKLGGTASNGVLSNTYYKIETPVQLRHDMAWVVEWSCGGDWSGMLLSAEGISSIEGNTYLFRSNQNTDFLGFGERRGGNYHNYGIALADYGIKTDEYHYYRLENRWDYEKETNMVYLMVDGVELGAMNNYFIGGTSDQNKTVDWVSGKDFVFSYMGADGHALNNMKPDFVQVWESDAPNIDYTPTPWPAFNTDLTHIVAYGQSFSSGSDAPVYPDPAVDGVYVYGSITDSSKGTALSPLATTGTQHPIISAGNSLAQMLQSDGIDTDLILGSYGTGGRTIAQLMSAERQAEIKAEEGYSYDINSSGRYAVFENSVSAIADYAESSGQSVSCPVIVYLQGETDQNTDEELGYPGNPIRAGYGAGGDKDKYKLYMTRLKEDMQTEVMEAYGQTEKPLFVIYQVSGTYVRTRYSSINMAQIEFAEENEDVILLQSPYFTPHYTGSHHLAVNGYRWLGEYIAKYVHEALVEGKNPSPMLPTSIKCVSENQIAVMVNPAEGGLTIDTYTVENATNSNNRYGFYLMVDGKFVTPKTVEVSGNEIILTMPDSAAALSAAESVYVYYGGQRAQGTGNIRDNCTDTGFYAYLDDSNDIGTGKNQSVSHSALDENGNSLVGKNYPLYNWLASFCYEIGSYTGHTHTYASTVIAPTCTEKGYTLYSCACGERYMEDYVDALGHKYESVVTKPTYTEKGYTTHTCTVCGDSYVDSYTDPRPLNVLMIGNSFTWDAADAGYGLEQSQMYDVITAMLAEGCSVELGVVVRGSTKLSYHYAHIEDATDYKYSQITAENGKWNPATPAANTSISKVLDSKDWDIVVLQSYREEMTGGNDVKTSLQNLLDYLAEHEEGAEVYYYMPWAATDVSEGDTLAKYKEIAAFTDANVMEIRGTVSGNTFAGVIPVGTGIQNARGTYLNELHYSNTEAGANPNIDSQRGLERDKQHVSFGIGRYIAGVIVAESLIPEELRKDSYSWPTIKDSPAVGAMPAEYNEIAQKAIEGALKTPYALTAISGYEEDPCSTMVSAIAKKDFDLTGVTNEAQLKAAIMEQVKAMLTKEGFAEPIVTVKDSKFVDGKLSTCQATVTLRFGYTTKVAEIVKHTHTYESVVTKPTCTEKGYTTHTCACGDSYVDSYVEALGHNVGDWETTIAATCTETGEERRDCANCDHYETRETASKGHTEVIDKAVESTCTETGLTEGKHCSVCETVLVKQNVVPAKGHSYEPVVTKPTCTEKGYTTHTCTACGDSYVDGETAALGHIEVIDKAVEATCTETGLTEGKHCSVCNTVLVKQNVVPAKGHSYESVVTKPTCTEKGYTTHTCTACGDSYVDSETAALGHKWDDGKVTREPTETVQGEKVYTCTVCGETRIEILPVLGHEHSYTSVVTKPTCTDKGYTTYTCNCGHSYIDNEVPALGHTEVIDKAVEATCTETGLTEGKHCSVCETVLVKQNVVPAKGHSYEPVVTKPTCTEKGYTTHTCTACGDSYVDSETAALGHKWDDGKVTREPTETVQGEKVYTCTVCGETRIEILPVLGHEHSYTSVETKPTCTEKGYTTYTCNCGHSYIDNEVPALGHTEVIDKAVEATCTGTGLTEGKHCSVCETVLVKQNVVPAKGHSFGSWVESTAPTCTESGEQKRECACGHVESRSVDALGHEEVVDEGVKPTCTEGGISDGKHCSRCGEILKAQENLPATGHSYGEKPELHWNEERTSCKIHFLCGDCDAIKVLTRPVLKEIDDENGEIVYTVTFQFGGKTYTETIREAIADPDEHRYDTDPKFFWSENNTSCKAYFHCSHCDGIKVKVCTVTSETDTENKKILHTATVEFEGKTFTDVREEVLKDILWGDANGDGRVNAMDATRILRYAAKLVAADQIDLTVSDVNDDGKVNAMDATRILRYAAKLITELRTEKLA